MMKTSWASRLREQFSSGRVVIQSLAGTRQLDIPGFGNLWLIGRDCCVYRKLPVGHIPAAKKEAVVRSQVNASSPYRNPGCWFFVRGDCAHIWIWDESRRAELQDSLPETIENEYQILPESIFSDGKVGTVLLEGVGSGCFAQYIDESGLQAENWWPGVPGQQEWHRFLRGIGQPPCDVPEPVALALSAPETWPGIGIDRIGLRSTERWLKVGTVAVFVFLLGFQLTGTVRLWTTHEALQSDVEALSQVNGRVIEVRDEVFELRDRVKQLAGINGVRQLQLMDEVSRQLPADSGTLVVWRLQESALEFVVNDQSPDLEEYVRQIEAVSSLTAVSVEPLERAGQIKVMAKVMARVQ